MDPEFSLQDVLWCHICETLVSHMYCDICQVNLGKLSLGEHLSDDLKEHKAILFKKKESTTMSKTFLEAMWTSLWIMWNPYMCSLYIVLWTWTTQRSWRFDRFRKEKKLQKDIKEFEKPIYPK